MLIETGLGMGHDHVVSFPHAAMEPHDRDATIAREARWRQTPRRGTGADIVLTRWVATSSERHAAAAVTPPDCHVIALALRPAHMSLSSRERVLFEGVLPTGTLLVSRPGQALRASVTPPFDFLHLHVDNRLLREEGLLSDQESSDPDEDATPFRDALAEALGRSLVEEETAGLGYAQVVARAIVMRAIGRRQAERRCRALPKWRLKRFDQFLADNIDKRISLGDMAASVGLSRMHFAAQFRAATGFRPREYLLYTRIERAKAMMLESDMPLVEIALSIGFNAQAHFSTVFKRFTSKAPAQWKQECRGRA